MGYDYANGKSNSTRTIELLMETHHIFKSLKNNSRLPHYPTAPQPHCSYWFPLSSRTRKQKTQPSRETYRSALSPPSANPPCGRNPPVHPPCWALGTPCKPYKSRNKLPKEWFPPPLLWATKAPNQDQVRISPTRAILPSPLSRTRRAVHRRRIFSPSLRWFGRIPGFGFGLGGFLVRG